MIIYLDRSKLFTRDPSERFADEYGVDKAIWQEMWKRHILLEYTLRDLCDYFELRSGRKARPLSIKRWLDRSKIYEIAHNKRKLGAVAVVSSIFGEYEGQVLKELTRHMQNGETVSNRSLL